MTVAPQNAVATESRRRASAGGRARVATRCIRCLYPLRHHSNGTFAGVALDGVKLSINPVAIRAAGLTVSSKLLRLATVVEKEVVP